MDRNNWMYGNRYTDPRFAIDMKSFLNAAQEDRVKKGKETISCPCMECKTFTEFKDIKQIEYHLLRNGFMFNYTCWSKHGESLASSSTTSKNLDANYNGVNNASHISHDNYKINEGSDNVNEGNDNINDMFDDLETNACNIEQEKLQQIFVDAEKPLYTNYSWSDKSFTCLLELLHDMLPKDNELPISVYQAKKLMCPMELEVQANENDEYDDDVTKNGPPAKNLSCYSDERKDDGKLRHVADSPQWRNFDYDYPEFGKEGPKQPGNDIDVYLSPLIDDLKTLWSLDIPGKTKDGIKVREDTKEMGIREELAPIEGDKSYMEGVKSIGVPKSRHSGRLAGVRGVGKKLITPPLDELKNAHFTVLQHMTCIDPYVNEHKKILQLTHLHKTDNWYTKQHKQLFSDWLKKKVEENYGEPNFDKTVEKLAKGADFRVRSFQGYDINGYTFYTKKQDDKSATQNSRVTQIASSTTVDITMIAKESYYGVIQEIWELSYSSSTIPLLKDGYKSKPFILATHATKVFFVKDPSKPRYQIVLQGKRRILGVDDVNDEEEYNQFDELPPFSVEKRTKGVSKCKKKFLNPDESTVAFDAIDRAVGKTGGEFMSWIGVEFRNKIPYNKTVREINPKAYEDIWQFAKETWKIPNDDAKIITLEKGKSIMRRFRYTLRKDYVYKVGSLDEEEDEDGDEDKVKEPFSKYDYLDNGLWESFVSAVENEDWKEKSQKAVNSAKHNTAPARLGRCGCRIAASH
ncbi:uncharacterized protein LOC143566274 [Bidens hawaiensis]|uniref:uncharacterized protein LOC143566274 n=1 Tax=Bidens hawaiensis TaxID=980011 RepID=UPI00404B6B60